MCQPQTVVFAPACGHYAISSGACASALAKDRTGRTPCNELIHEVEFGSIWVAKLEGRDVTVIDKSGKRYSRTSTVTTNHSERVGQSQVAVADGDASEASNSDGSADSSRRGTRFKAKASEGRAVLWRMLKRLGGE